MDHDHTNTQHRPSTHNIEHQHTNTQHIRDLLDRVGISEDVLLSTFASEEDSSIHSDGGSMISASLHSSLLSDEDSPMLGRYAGSSTKHQQLLLTQSGLQDKILTLEHEKNLLEIEVERVRKRYESDMFSVRKELQAQIQRLVSKQTELDNELPQLRERLGVVKKDLQDLKCSSELYQELKEIPYEKMSVKEYVLVNAYELVSSFRAQVESLRMQLEEERNTSTKLKYASEKADGHLGEVKLHLQEQVERLERQVRESKAAQNATQQTCDEYVKLVATLKDKGDRYDLLKSKCDETEKQLGMTRVQAEQALEMATLSKNELAGCKTETSDAQQMAELLKVDKMYLERELEQTKHAIVQLEKKLERQQEKTREAKRACETMEEEFKKQSASGRSEHELHFQSELDALKRRNEEELNQLKQVQQQIMDRQVRSLREEKEGLVSLSEEQSVRIRNLTSELDDCKLLVATKDASNESLLMDVRNQVKMKTFELGRVEITLEEKSVAMQQLTRENEMLQKKLQVLKEDFHALEATHRQAMIDAQSKIKSEEDKLATYEAMEIELDTMLIANEASNAGLSGEMELEEELPVQPSDRSRRLPQLRTMAQRLVHAKVQVDKLRAESSELRKENDRLAAEVEHLNERVQLADQPQSYAVNALERRDQELAHANQQVSRLKETCEKLTRELDASAEERSQMHRDLETLLAERGKLEELVKRERASLEAQVMKLTKENQLLVGQQAFESEPVMFGSTVGLGTSPARKNHYSTHENPYPARDAQRSPVRGDSDVPRPGSHVVEDPTDTLLEVDDCPDPEPRDQVPEQNDSLQRHKPFGAAAVDDGLTISQRTTSSMASDDTVFILHREDAEGLPLPKWYKRLRQPAGDQEY